MSRISIPPVASKLTLNDNPVVVIGVGRGGVGRDDGARWRRLPRESREGALREPSARSGSQGFGLRSGRSSSRCPSCLSNPSVSVLPACSTSSPPPEKRSTNSAENDTRRPVGGYHITPLPRSVPDSVRRVLTET